MKFQRYLKLPSDWYKRNDIDQMALINSDEAKWRIGKNDVFDEIVEDFYLPRKFKVFANIVPIEIAPESRPFVIVEIDGNRLENYVLYENKDNELENLAKYEAIEFRLKKVVSDDDSFKHLKTILESGSLIARRDFLLQREDVFVKSETNKATGETVITPPGVLGGRALWPYGGYYRSGCGLEKIEQVVFVASAKKWRYSDVSLRRASEWVEHGVLIDGSTNKEGCFINDMSKHAMNTKTWFELGEAKLKIPMGTNEQGEEVFVCYKSCGVKQNDIGAEIFEISFESENL